MSTYKNGPGNVPRLPDRVVDTLIDSAGVSCLACGPRNTALDQTANVERLVHEACEELLARLPAAPVMAGTHRLAPDKVEKYIKAADLDLGPESADEWVEECRTVLRAAAASSGLAVWYGSMPESNGKSNFTAILHRKDAKGLDKYGGFTIARSEYPERVRYEADCVRHLIGELADKPCILDYDADKHSGYVPPTAPAVRADELMAVARACVAQGCTIAMEDWLDAQGEKPAPAQE